MSEYDYYIDGDFSGYAGKWIGIFQKKVVVSGKSFKEVAEKVDENFPKKKVLIARIPLAQVQIL
mgnify:CR=1 FL=1